MTSAENVPEQDVPKRPTPNTIRFMIATDNHLGFAEGDCIRGDDSFNAFEEILQLSLEYNVDGLLLAGDLFHENKPSRRCMYRTMELLRHYCLGDALNTSEEDGENCCRLQMVSDATECLSHRRFGTANWEDGNFNVRLPVFAIHGNHDDPSGSVSAVKGKGNTANGDDLHGDITDHLAALDLLATAGLVNYFGRVREVDDIGLHPILLKKGTCGVALWGLGAVRDERLHRTFQSNHVRFLRPSPEDTQAAEVAGWFNVLALHQNRVARSPTAFIPPSFLPSFLDLIVWGHEHDCAVEPELCSNAPTITDKNDHSAMANRGSFYITQPGSSVATSMAEGECRRAKCIAVVDIQVLDEGNGERGGGLNSSFRLYPIVLKTVRPMLVREMTLKASQYRNISGTNRNEDTMGSSREQSVLAAIQGDLLSVIKKMSLEAQQEWLARNMITISSDSAPLPLVRLKIILEDDVGQNDGTASCIASFHPHRLAQALSGIVANPREAISLHRRRLHPAHKSTFATSSATSTATTNNDGNGEDEDVSVEALMSVFLAAQQPKLLPANEFLDTLLRSFIGKDDREALLSFVQGSLERVSSKILSNNNGKAGSSPESNKNSGNGSLAMANDAFLQEHIERVRRAREAEWAAQHNQQQQQNGSSQPAVSPSVTMMQEDAVDHGEDGILVEASDDEHQEDINKLLTRKTLASKSMATPICHSGSPGSSRMTRSNSAAKTKATAKSSNNATTAAASSRWPSHNI